MIAQFDGNALAGYFSNIERICCLIEFITNPPRPGASVEETLRDSPLRYRVALAGLLSACEVVGLSLPVRLMLERLIGSLTDSQMHPHEYRDLANRVLVARQAVLDDLSQHRFIFIPPTVSHLLVPGVPYFGEDVRKTFPDAERDIEDAGRCLALGQGTASVFHCMRALELALRKFAEHLQIQNIQINWQNIIDQIEKQIAVISKGSTTPAKTAAVTAYFTTASEFKYFKDAWRNHVAHAKVHYEEARADVVYQHTKTFMHLMSTDILTLPAIP